MGKNKYDKAVEKIDELMELIKELESSEDKYAFDEYKDKVYPDGKESLIKLRGVRRYFRYLALIVVMSDWAYKYRR